MTSPTPIPTEHAPAGALTRTLRSHPHPVHGLVRTHHVLLARLQARRTARYYPEPPRVPTREELARVLGLPAGEIPAPAVL